MKKTVKSLEYPSIRIYEQVVRRIFLNNLSLILFILFLSAATPLFAGLRPTFLVFDASTLSDQVRFLEENGARVRQRIPPQILIADLPDTMNPATLPSIKSYYTSAIAVSGLEPMGTLAMAAGLQWNRNVVTRSKDLGQNSFAAARVLVSQRSFTALENFNVTPEDSLIHVSWTPQEGAMYYDLEMAGDPSFSTILHHTQTNLNSLIIPAAATAGSVMYVRVRPVDHGQGAPSRESDIFGPWSVRRSVTIPSYSMPENLPAPEPSSPLDNFQTEGFTLPLEWTDASDVTTRVQLSRSSSFSDPVIDEVVSGREFIVPSQPLHVGDSFYWRIQKWGDNTSPWSTGRRVRIGAPHHSQTDMFVAPDAPQ